MGEIEVFAGVDGQLLEEIVETFKRFRLRSKVEIESVVEDFSRWKNQMLKVSGGVPGSTRLQCWDLKPSMDGGGSEIPAPLVEVDEETVEENNLLWRIGKGVAEGSTEIPKGEAIRPEYNLEGLKANRFDKGCYLGQESIARTRQRGVIRKRSRPLKFLDNQEGEAEPKAAPGSEVVEASSGKRIGTVTTAMVG